MNIYPCQFFSAVYKQRQKEKDLYLELTLNPNLNIKFQAHLK